MQMHKIRVIAAREYSAAVRTKAFIISLLVMPILMGGSILVQAAQLEQHVGRAGGGHRDA